MDELVYVYLTGLVIGGTFLYQWVSKKFDPFAPVWMFLLGYFQVYVVQAISYHEYAIRVRGVEVTTEANSRALWAICWFLLVYFAGPGKWLASKLPSAPQRWSRPLAIGLSPFLLVWGLLSAWLVFRMVSADTSLNEMSQEGFLFLQFPVLMLVAGVILIVTGRKSGAKSTPLVLLGSLIGVGYVFLWMLNTKRSHSVFGVLATTAALYISRGKRPRMPVLILTALAGILALSISIGWRNNRAKYTIDVPGFVEFLGDFQLESIFSNMNIEIDADGAPQTSSLVSRETEEYGGYLLMLDTVPHKSPYDYGACYLRIVSTYIPRLVWPDKPLYGREEWISAWIAGSEYKREADFTGPAIGILGATQLNGGAIATAIVLAALATLIKTAYEYFRLYESTPWAQLWWSMTYYNAWLMTVNDDPFIWFYYVYGHTTFPPLGLLWLANKFGGKGKG